MSGPQLMKEFSTRSPDLTIEELLDQVRNKQLSDYASRLKTIQTNSALELLETAIAWDLAQEDVERLLKIMASEFSSEIASEARRLLEGDLGWAVYVFMQKHYTPPQPKGCFFRAQSWPWCSRSSSTSGTGHQ